MLEESLLIFLYLWPIALQISFEPISLLLLVPLPLLVGWSKSLTLSCFFFLLIFPFWLFYSGSSLAHFVCYLAFLSFYTAPGVTIQAEMIEQHS